MKNILVFPAGSEIAHEIFDALKYSKFVKLFGATSVHDHGEYWFENMIYNFPYIDNPEFIDFLNKVIDKYEIDYVYPAYDSVCCLLSEHKDEIKAEVIVTEYNTTKICRSKSKTYQFFSGEEFIPQIFNSPEDVDEFPVFLKPDVGQGAKGTKRADDLDALKFETDKNPQLIICEYLPGKEYTVDCFTDKNGRLRIINPRTRERIKDGISVKSNNVFLDEKMKRIATIINQKLIFRGAWFFQLKFDKNNNYKLLEISPRIPGTMGLSRNLGINFPMLTLFDYWGYDIEVYSAKYSIEVDRALSSSYRLGIEYNHVYLDFDDTLIINEKVNDFLMMYLYQCVNKGKKIHLITKHRGDINEVLLKKKISRDLFDEICILGDGEKKKDKILERDSIFIDDSFAERKEIASCLAIPVFDIDMVESLVDWRR